MKTLNIIFASMISATLMVSISNTALAHSEHDRTPLPLSWTFNDSVREKISRAMKDEAHMGLVGLSHHEQTVLERYGIRVDQSFYTPVNGGQALVQRTQAGLKILESTTPVSSEFRWQAPVIKKSRVVQSSTPAMNHPGHHHR
ncbi:MAG: hypothetical protein GWM98_20775, partial [Nitrospinaceae bacterium]|nr:hypothetical protein [Nitrospinaceae bacterium]NIR56458.1 hypothetical protein [Nitrospinaceae bacterium]NIS86919.1 hypothetical protein [Nitrospinaceae bacterium]NIT83757.1 hypothetical protein [Nitrospinaceae bacterium]NIU45960.1 hypothetical protein [Nitrospinaceae bacterium]